MKLGSGDIQFQGCLLHPAVAICICFHKPSCVPDRDKILAYLSEQGIDLNAEFSLVLDGHGKEDVLLVFGDSKTLDTFWTLVKLLIALRDDGTASGLTTTGTIDGALREKELRRGVH